MHCSIATTRSAATRSRCEPLERCIEIFGEAAKSISSDLRNAHPEIPWSDMAKIRDRLSHHYHRIDHALLWTIAEQNVPIAAGMVRQIQPPQDESR
ncbi:MAG: DUF86 domain-containing protein [Acidimicrobiia bacterium]